MSSKKVLALCMGLALSVVLTSAASSQVGPVGPRALLASASSTEKFTKLAINGNGTINYASPNCASKGLVCASGDTCECIEITGNYKGNVVGAGTFDFIVDSDTTTGFAQGTGQNEFFGAGLITLTSGSNTLTFETSGLVGNSALGVSAQYNGSYGVSLAPENSPLLSAAAIRNGGTGISQHQLTPKFLWLEISIRSHDTAASKAVPALALETPCRRTYCGGMGVFKENQLVEVSTGSSPSVGQQRGNDAGPFSDLYLYLITCPWPLLILQISAIFFLANGLFATGYYLDAGVQQARTFSDAYFFSVQTMATIGYGRLTPLTLFSNVLMSVEALTGIFGIAVITGLIFAKFSRPTARVRFSAKAVISTRDGVPSLMFRMANERENQIVEAQIHVVFSRMERTLEGEETRRFQDLQLVRGRNAIFVYSWTAIHQIIPGSPLYGETAESLAATNAWILVALTGLDETLSQTVHARNYYGAQNIIWGARMTDIMVRNKKGGFSIDYSKFDLVEPAAPLRIDNAGAKALSDI